MSGLLPVSMAVFMDAREVAGYLNLSLATVYRLAGLGIVPGFRAGRRWRFEKGAVDHYLRVRQLKGGARAREESHPAGMTDSLGIALERTVATTGMDRATILTLERQALRVLVSRGAGAELLAEKAPVPLGECLCGRAAMGEIVLCRDVLTDRRATREGCRQNEFRGRMCVPLRNSVSVLGVLILSTRDPLEDGPALKVAEGFADMLAMLWESWRLHERTAALADTDPLTGLCNQRRLWQELDREVARAQRLRRPLSLVVVDVDLLKGINDRFGHQAGDQLLQGVARILQSGLRASDMACRYGGDEFVLLLPETSGSDAGGVARRLQRLVAAWSFRPGGVPVTPVLSMGIACFPEDATSSQELFAKADRAMLQAKTRDGRDAAAGESRSP